MYTPAHADATIPDDPGSKTQEHFEISNIVGFRDAYNPGEEVSFYVEGASPAQIVPAPQSGFHVQATIFIDNEKSPYAGVNGKYDEDKHAWQVTFTALSDTAKSYRLVIALYCATEPSLCVDTYGQAVQITKTLPLQVH